MVRNNLTTTAPFPRHTHEIQHGAAETKQIVVMIIQHTTLPVLQCITAPIIHIKLYYTQPEYRRPKPAVNRKHNFPSSKATIHSVRRLKPH